MSAHTRPTFRTLYPETYRREAANTATMEAWQAGALLVPTSATYELLTPLGVSVASGAASIVSDVATYSLAAIDLPSTLSFGEGYSAQWVITIDGVEYPVRREVCIARFPLHPMIADPDLVRGEYPMLLADISGLGADFQGFIDQAYGQVVRWLWAHGRWPDIIVSQHDLVEPVRQKALYLIHKALFGKRDDDRFKTLMEIHGNEAMGALATLSTRLDRDNDGTVDSLDREAVSGVVHTNIRPEISRSHRSRAW